MKRKERFPPLGIVMPPADKFVTTPYHLYIPPHRHLLPTLGAEDFSHLSKAIPEVFEQSAVSNEVRPPRPRL